MDHNPKGQDLLRPQSSKNDSILVRRNLAHRSYMLYPPPPMALSRYTLAMSAPNAFSFCTVAGNPPIWGCNLCKWMFANDNGNPTSDQTLYEQARIAHGKHECPENQSLYRLPLELLP
jgi:hypothetical protein